MRSTARDRDPTTSLLRAAGARALRRRPGLVVHDDAARGRTTPCSCRSTRARRPGQPAAGNPPARTGTHRVPLGEVWERDPGWTSSQRFVHVEQPAKEHRRRKSRPTIIFPGTTSGTRSATGRRTRAARRRATTTCPALGGFGQVEHDRLAGPPPVDRCTTTTTRRCSTRSS